MPFDLSRLFPPKRPRGCAPFDSWLKVFKWFETGRDPAIQLMTEKIDGFQLVVVWDGSSVRLYTKNGVPITATSTGVLGLIRKAYFRDFAHVTPQAVRHPKYGRARALFAEVAVRREDAVRDNSECGCDLEDLGPMMRKKGLENADWVLKVFHCSFAKDDPLLKKKQRAAVPLAERLDLCRQALGEDFVVRTLIDARRPFDQADLDAAHECYLFKEGVVVVGQDGVIRKDKALRPVSMLLVAVGLSNVRGVTLPTHFFWAVPDSGAYSVPLVDDRRFLFEDGRVAKGKVQLQTSMFCIEDGHFRLYADRANYQTEAYSALLQMVGAHFVPASTVTACEAVLKDGRKLRIGPNRRMKFNDPDITQLLFPARFRQGIIGANQLWMTGKEPRGVSEVHFQAPQFLACPGYGHPVFQRLLDEDENTTPAATIVWLSTEASRDLRVHAKAVYVENPPNLVYGDAFEEPDSDQWSTPGHSDEE